MGKSRGNFKKIIEFKIDDLLGRSTISLDQEPISNQLLDKIILITGAAGSIGSELAKQIITFNPAEIIILDQAETPLHFLSSEMEKLNSDTKITAIIADIRNKETLKRIFKRKNRKLFIMLLPINTCQ